MSQIKMTKHGKKRLAERANVKKAKWLMNSIILTTSKAYQSMKDSKYYVVFKGWQTAVFAEDMTLITVLPIIDEFLRLRVKNQLKRVAKEKIKKLILFGPNYEEFTESTLSVKPNFIYMNK